MSSNWVNSAAEICVSKDGNGRYIKVKKPFKMLKDNNLILTPFKQHLQGLVKAGFMDENKMNETLENVHWVKYVVSVPPQEFKTKDEGQQNKNGWLNNALELRESKDQKLYIKANNDFEVQEGDNIPLTKFEDHIEFLFKNQYIDQESRDRRIKAAEFVYYLGSIPPKG